MRAQNREADAKFAKAAGIEERLRDACFALNLPEKAFMHGFSAAGCWAQAGDFYHAVWLCDTLLAKTDLPTRLRERIENFAQAVRGQMVGVSNTRKDQRERTNRMNEVPASEKTMVFDLTRAEIAPIVAVLAGEPVQEFTVEVRPDLQGQRGWNALTLVPTFRYETVSGRTDTGDVFVKRFTNTRGREAANYAYLHKHGYPAPLLYGSLSTDAGEEILFLQRLERIGSVNDPEKQSRQTLLGLTA